MESSGAASCYAQNAVAAQPDDFHRRDRGMPRFVLRKGDFGLPYFGIRVSYSSGVENAKDTGPTLVPDIQTGLTFEQYMNGDDPALDAILSIPPPQ